MILTTILKQTTARESPTKYELDYKLLRLYQPLTLTTLLFKTTHINNQSHDPIGHDMASRLRQTNRLRTNNYSFEFTPQQRCGYKYKIHYQIHIITTTIDFLSI